MANINIEILNSIVRKAGNRHDPEGLLGSAPPDEYESEIKDITEGIINNNPQSPLQVANIVALVWFWHFGEWSRPLQYDPDAYNIGKDIWIAMMR